MDEEYLIGFDARAMWLSREELWPHIKWDKLLKPDIERWLSIQRLVWPTVFMFQQVRINGWPVGTAPACDLEIPFEHRTPDSFWDELEVMRLFMDENNQSFQRQSWLIALSVVQTSNYYKALEGNDPWSFAPIVLDQVDISHHWTRLGYDVQTHGPAFGEGLGSIYPDIQDEMRERWGKQLNEYHLFDERQHAIEYAEWQYIREPMLGIQFVYGLYLIQPYLNV
jgi:hypothetical protein